MSRTCNKCNNQMQEIRGLFGMMYFCPHCGNLNESVFPAANQMPRPSVGSYYSPADTFLPPFKPRPLDMSEITPEIGVGASPDTLSNLNDLREAGYTAIMNLLENHEYRIGEDEIDFIRENFVWRNYATIDSMNFGVPSLRWIDATTREVERLVDAGHKVYIHCRMGKGRSPLIVLAHLTINRHMNFGEAVAVLREGRDYADPNIHQVHQLLRYAALREKGEPLPPEPIEKSIPIQFDSW